MINSPLFNATTLELVQNNLLGLLNSCRDFENARIINSPRAVGDTVQEILGERMSECFPKVQLRILAIVLLAVQWQMSHLWIFKTTILLSI